MKPTGKEKEMEMSQNSWLCHEVSQKTIQSYNYVPINVKPVGGGREFQLYLTSHFCPGVGNLTAILWKMSNPYPMTQCTSPLLACH